VLGLIFLRFAEVRFAAQRARLEKSAASSRRGSRVDEPDAYHAEGVREHDGQKTERARVARAFSARPDSGRSKAFRWRAAGATERTLRREGGSVKVGCSRRSSVGRGHAMHLAAALVVRDPAAAFAEQ
jgi:hypothetical protein